MEDCGSELERRAAVLAEALRELPADGLTMAALCELAVSAVIALTCNPAAVRILFEARLAAYEANWGAPCDGSGQVH